MEFSDALVYLKSGQKVARKIWENRKYVKVGVGELGRKTLLFGTSTGSEGVYLATNSDILAEDWEVLQEIKDDSPYFGV